jgi:superfamily I DNA/RNA helicase/mRNA-degrading endonuclease YafQ of YafQ-DinJ toxin-antitoxin module
MFAEVLMSRDFDKAFRQLQPQKQKIVRQKIDFLRVDRKYPSLKVHQLVRLGKDIWEMYIDRGARLLYEIRDQTLILWQMGGHEVVDYAHRRNFDHPSQLLRYPRQVGYEQDFSIVPQVAEGAVPLRTYRQEHVQDEAPSVAAPEDAERNYFAYFRSAHLNVLGVPEEQVQSVQTAQTLNEVFALPDLPAQALHYLMDLATSPDMQTVLLDPSQLLYRTRLDRLDGYLEGRIKKLMLHLHPAQQGFVDFDRPLHLLKGTAGCGKTTIGIYRAIRLAEQGKRVLVVTFNKILASATETLIEELIGPLPRNLEVRTIHSFMISLLSTHPNIPKDAQRALPRKFLHEALVEVRSLDKAQVLKRDEQFFQEEIQNIIKGLDLVSVEAYKAIKRYGRKTALGPTQREAVWKVYQAYQKRMDAAKFHEWADIALLVLRQAQTAPLNKVYDHIIVDEAQDLKPVDLRVVQLLVDPQGTLMVLGDAAQTLYSRGFSWVQAGIAARGHTSILHVNYRNTSQIAEAASQLIMKNVLMRASNEYVDPQWTRREGSVPLLLRAPARYQQIDLVSQEIGKLLSEQRFRLSDIAILSCDNASCDLYKDILIGKGLPAVMHQDPSFNILEDQIKVITIYSAKGLEFPVVFLMGLIFGDFPRPLREHIQDDEEARLEVERARMLCYVGMTRAADLLYLVTVRGQESPFISELAGKIEPV